MGPGNTALTLMPDGASSAAATWVRPRSAHFDDPYAAWLGNGRIAPVLQVLTMAAPSARAQMLQRRTDAQERAEAVDPPAALEARRRLVGQ